MGKVFTQNLNGGGEHKVVGPVEGATSNNGEHTNGLLTGRFGFLPISGKANSFTLDPDIDSVIKVDTTGNAVTGTLPAATGSGRLYPFLLHTLGAGNFFTIARAGADTIRGLKFSGLTSLVFRAAGDFVVLLDAAPGQWEVFEMRVNVPAELTAALTLDESLDDVLVPADTSVGTFAIALKAASGSGRIHRIWLETAGNDLDVDADGTDTFDGTNTKATLNTAGEWLDVQDVASGRWKILSDNGVVYAA